MRDILLVVISAWVILWGWKTLYWTPMKMNKYFKDQGINGPPYNLSYGNLEKIVSLMIKARSKPMELSHRTVSRILTFEHQAIKDYGKMFVSWIGTTPRVDIMDQDMIRNILSNKIGHFTKRMSLTFCACTSDLVSNLEEIVSEGPCEVDIWTHIQHLTSDIISRAAFGTTYEEGRCIFELQTEMADLTMQLARSIYTPGFRFRQTKQNTRMKEIYRKVRSLVRDKIKQRETAMKDGVVSSTDNLLGLLMESNMKEIKDNKLAMNIDEVIEECKLFYIARQETTSTLLVWTMISLSMHPEWQQKAREVVLHVFVNKKPDFDCLSNLKIVIMIFNEVLCLYPPVGLRT